MRDDTPRSGDQADPRRVATPGDFGRELTALRERAGLTVRAVARATGLPASTIGDYFSGRHLPLQSQPGVLEAILRVCGEADADRLGEWERALTRARKRPGRRPSRARSPYRGLARFEPEDAAWFFGREEVTERLVDLAASAWPRGGPPDPGEARGWITEEVAKTAGLPLTVVGPSGSGKSSLLRAGLIPRLTGVPADVGVNQATGATTRPVILFTPAAHPFAELAALLNRSGAAQVPEASAGEWEAPASAEGRAAELAAIDALDPASGLVIVVDQFEEVFTECRDEQERRLFITAISALAHRFTVALALRADFYDRALRYPELAAALQQRQVVLSPMTRHQLRRAICEPARLAGLDVEDVLVELLLRDLAPESAAGQPAEAAHEAGALPLLSHSLLVTWEHHRGGRLTVADYLASGGIRQAIAQTAENVYARLDQGQQEMAQRIFLRLVQVSDDSPVTRASVALSDLNGQASGVPADDLLTRFVDERLISVGPETAQITHDALLTEWPRLRAWIEAGHESLRMRRRIGQAAQPWLESGRDSAALLRGAPLAMAREWAAASGNLDTLDAASRGFLEASITAERTRQQVERIRTRRLQRLVTGLTVLALITLGLAGYAFRQRQEATAARNAATSARYNADSRSTAIEGDQIRGLDVSLAAQLSLAAYRIDPTAQARASLLESSATPAAARMLDSAGVVQAVALSPSHQVLAVAAADGTLRLWNVSRPGHPASLGRTLEPPNSKHPLYAAAFSPDGQILAAAGAATTVTLWNARDPHLPVKIGQPIGGPGNTVYSLAFSPHHNLLAAGSADKKVWLWNVAKPSHPILLAALNGFAGYVESVAFSPDGKTLAAGSNDKTIRLWNISNPARPELLGKVGGPTEEVTSVAFSPNGTMLAAGSQDHKVWLWHITRQGRPTGSGQPLTGAADWVNAVAFSPDGTTIAAGSSDNSVRTWNISTHQQTATLPESQPVTALAWDGIGHLISGDANGTAAVWSLPSPILSAGSLINGIAYSPNGQLLAVASNTLELWNPAGGKQLADIPSASFAGSVAFSSRGILAAGYGNGTVQLWRVGTSGLTALGTPIPASGIGSASTDTVESVAFSPDGKILATGADDGTIRLWSVSDPAHPRKLAVRPDSGTIVYTVAFSPNGRTLAAASADSLTTLWNVSNPAAPSKLSPSLHGPTSYAISTAFSSHGNLLAVGSADGTIHLWNVRDPARPRALGGPLTGPSGYVYALAFSPGGHTLAAGITDGTVWLWNTSAPTHPALIAALTGPTEQVFSVAFAPDGRTLAAGSADGTVRLWDTSVHAAATGVCATAGQPLTKHEWSTYLPGLPYHPPCSAR